MSETHKSPLTLRVLRRAWEWAKVIAVAFVLYLGARAFLVEAFKIPSGSMEGTLLVGDFLIVNKALYGAEVPFTGGKHLPAVRAPRHGDVMVFQPPKDPTKMYVKRLMGLPGDTIAMKDGVVIRNGLPLAEGYARHEAGRFELLSDEFRWQAHFLAPGVDARRYRPTRSNWGPIVVPSSHYFMLGDNRDFSDDSRFWGFVPDSMVRGSPIFVYYSYVPDSSATFDWLTNVRWRRLGSLVR